MTEKPKTILIVDDEPENVRNYGEILTDLGYQVIARGNVDSALALLKSNIAVDLVITDYRMPGKTGLEFIVALRHLHPLLPVVMITAYGNIETYVQSMSLGAFEYVNKPIKKKEFERIIQHALKKHSRKNPSDKDNHEHYSYH